MRQERASDEWTLRASVGIGSRHWSVRKVRAPLMTSSPPLGVMVTGPPGIMVRDTGAGPQAAFHCWTL